MEKKVKELLDRILEVQEDLLIEVEALKKTVFSYIEGNEKNLRELARKVLEVDNELNRKFRALGEELVELKSIKTQKKTKRKRKKPKT